MTTQNSTVPFDKSYLCRVFFLCKNVNSNGTPTTGNLPRFNADGFPFMSHVSVKHHIRDQLIKLCGPENVLTAVSKDTSLEETLAQDETVQQYLKQFISKGKSGGEDGEECAGSSKELDKYICEKYIDARLFGMLCPFTENLYKALFKKKGSCSAAAQGAIQPSEAISYQRCTPEYVSISKSFNGTMPGKKGGKSSDTMGGGYYNIPHSIMAFTLSTSIEQCRKNGVTEDDILLLRRAMANMFHETESAARRAGALMTLCMAERVVPDDPNVLIPMRPMAFEWKVDKMMAYPIEDWMDRDYFLEHDLFPDMRDFENKLPPADGKIYVSRIETV